MEVSPQLVSEWNASQFDPKGSFTGSRLQKTANCSDIGASAVPGNMISWNTPTAARAAGRACAPGLLPQGRVGSRGYLFAEGHCQVQGLVRHEELPGGLSAGLGAHLERRVLHFADQ